MIWNRRNLWKQIFGTIRLEMVRLCLKVQCQENAWYILQIPIIILGILILTNL